MDVWERMKEGLLGCVNAVDAGRRQRARAEGVECGVGGVAVDEADVAVKSLTCAAPIFPGVSQRLMRRML